jgi:beta-lactamase regulating signal transducer with metallopeptidase domain
MLAIPDIAVIARLSAERIVYCLVEGTLVAAFAGCLVPVLRGRNAGTRFAVWFSAMVAIAVLPLLGGVWGSGAGPAVSGAQAARSAITLPSSWALYLFGVWATGAALALARLGAGLLEVRALRESCVEIDLSRMEPALRETLGRYRASRPIALCVSERVQAPTAIGLRKPAVIMPEWLLEELTPAELHQVLVHELAHLGRWDDWTNLAQKILKALLFFHPAVWWIEQKLSLEREMACDDAVLAETRSPRAYAECLTHLAERSFLRRSAALVQAAVGRVRETSLRVAKILDVNRPRATNLVWKPAVSLIAIFAIACLASLERAPRLVAFRPRTAPAAAGSVPQPSRAGMAIPATSFPGAASGAHERRERVLAQPVERATASPPTFRRLSLESENAFFAEQENEQENLGFGSVASTPLATEVKDSGGGRWAAREALLVLVVGRQSASPGSSTYQICVWHITVLAPAGNSSPKEISRKVI